MKSIVIVAVSGAVLLAAAGVGRTEGKAVVSPTGDLKWTDSKAIPGAKRAGLWGDPAAGAYASLNRLAGGTVLPNHWHSFDHKVMMVSGTIAFTIDGATKDLAAGSYAMIPAKVPHSATCKAGADCMYFEESSGKDDMVLAEGAKK